MYDVRLPGKTHALKVNEQSMKKLRILITSVGSMVGFNILESLCHPEFNRRDRVFIIGMNSVPSVPNNFRCDACYLCPSTADPNYPVRFKQLLEKENPDIVLCGRDEDTLALSHIFQSDESLKCVFPYGSQNSIELAYDKMKTWQFAQKHNLPFADTMLISKKTGLSAVESFVKQSGLPLIAKPVHGFSSNDVYFIRNLEEIGKIRDSNQFLLQELLGDTSNLQAYFVKTDGPPMLFSHLPDVWVYSCQVIIQPDGNMSPVFIARQDHKMGYTIKFRKLQNRELAEFVQKYAEAYYREGGYGAFSIQFKQNEEGAFKAIEINARHTGATFARTLSGRDEIGLIVDAFLPDFKFPIFENSKTGFDRYIYRIYHSEVVTDQDVQKLETAGEWYK